MIGLVHLVWAPLGSAPLREFLRSYRTHSSGTEHELTILFNGARLSGALSREQLLVELGDTEHRLLELECPVLDLDAYGEAAAWLEHDTVCFLNSYSVVLVDGWLARLADALALPDVGLVGASGSWESQAEWTRGRLRHWPMQLALLPRSRRDYPRFPNPHVRTSAFMLERRRLLEMSLPQATDKRAAYLLESGPNSVTRRIQEQGLRAVVATRDGRVYDVEQWPESHTFRSGEQEGLLVADNQTRDYQTASPRRRRRLTRDSWGY